MTALALPDLPAGSAAPPARRPLLGQCLVLAGLLHLLVVLVFGNTPGGSARPGEGLWGAFQVRLVGAGPAGRPDAAAVDAPHTGPPGQADSQRFGGAVRPDGGRRPADEPGAARAGRWLPQVAEGDAQAPPLATPTNTADAAVPALALAELPARQSVDAGRPLPAADAPSPGMAAQALPTAPAAVAVLPARQVLRPAGPVAPVLGDPAPTVALQAPPLPAFQVQAPSAARAVALPPPVRALVPLALPDLPAPTAPPLPGFATETASPARALAPQAAVRSLAPLSSADWPVPPAPLPAMPSFAVQAAPPPRTLAQRERPSAVGALAPADLPAAAAVAPPLPSFAAQAAAPPRAVVARVAPPAVTPPAPADLALQAAAKPALPQFAVAASEGAAPPAATAHPATAPSPSQTPTGVAAPVPASPLGVGRVAGAPDAGARLGHDIATAASQPASAARLNLDLVRPRGGLIAAQGSRGLLSVLPHPPELKTKLEKEIELAGLADCRKAYSAMGLAAALPLAADALREKGCRW